MWYVILNIHQHLYDDFGKQGNLLKKCDNYNRASPTLFGCPIFCANFYIEF